MPEILLKFGVPIVVALVIILSFWKKVPADKAMVITGLKKRMLSGKGGLMLPILETSCTISLEDISMKTNVSDAPSKQGIFVNIEGTAVVKVKNEEESVFNAVERFHNGGASKTVDVIKSIVDQIIEGQLRGIVSTMTVEELNADRAGLETKLENAIVKELGTMGLILSSFSILRISTQGGYLENKAKPQIAQAQADADIAEADRQRDTQIKTAEAQREGQRAKLEAETAIAESERDKQIKIEAYRAEREQAKATADIAYEIQDIQNKAKQAEEQAKLEEKKAVIKEKQLVVEVQKPAEASKKASEVNAEAAKIQAIKQAEAEAEALKLKAQAEAEARKISAQAEAEAIKLRGQAEAEAIRSKGLAEAEAKDKLAEAMAKYGEAAVTELIIAKLPEIMEQVAKPLEKIDKITIIDNGNDGAGGASKVAKIVSEVATSGFETLKQLTGVDVTEVLKSVADRNDKVDDKVSKKIDFPSKEGFAEDLVSATREDTDIEE
ncbi:putative flotillin [Gottschalkia acidurici 9a]|uniref:Flotillin n=1 Tax=Gottschalkia acidurici (strain ATCC 7906 / DSM 604 / BCRC 14475 / CIP 104303 / KCTC 5404 / NCIMB 10678 / 9a) TaxID=1128398 RepID=K0B085_GOTA9|nr:SPFH domain-containing protein [Gottschalkia acidurici]AFS78061.1 putative flotillin [Gottschalkia acidurici 9a]